MGQRGGVGPESRDKSPRESHMEERHGRGGEAMWPQSRDQGALATSQGAPGATSNGRGRRARRQGCPRAPVPPTPWLQTPASAPARG